MQQPPTPPSPPTTPTPAGMPASAAPVAQTFPARPLTPAEISAIRSQRSELSSQLTSAAGRREELVEQLENATGQNRAGLEDRMAVLDKRIVQLENDIAETGRLLTAPQNNVATTSQPSTLNPLGMSSKQTTAVSLVFTLFVMAPLAFALARVLWNRATRSNVLPDAGDVSRRLMNLEQSIDAIALEIERVSEGQRYVTKLFTEARTPALSAGESPAEPIRVDRADRVVAPRNER